MSLPACNLFSDPKVLHDQPVLLLDCNDKVNATWLAEQGAKVTVVSPDSELVRSFDSDKCKSVHAPTLGYLRGSHPQQFKYVFSEMPVESIFYDHYANCLEDHLQRVTQFHGTVYQRASGDWEVFKKRPGFLLSSYPRCGTNMMITALSQHPQLDMHGEVCVPTSPAGRHHFRGLRQVTEAFWQTPRSGFAAHAFLGRRGQVFNPAPKWYENFWRELPRPSHVISLRRRDLFARHVSHFKAKQRRVWVQYQGDRPLPEIRPIRVDPQKLMIGAKEVRECWQDVDRRYPDCLVVYYEDLRDDWERTLQRVYEHLRIDQVPVKPTTQRVSGTDLSEQVVNYNQVIKAVTASPGKLKQLRGD